MRHDTAFRLSRRTKVMWMAPRGKRALRFWPLATKRPSRLAGQGFGALFSQAWLFSVKLSQDRRPGDTDPHRLRPQQLQCTHTLMMLRGICKFTNVAVYAVVAGSLLRE